jgi:hypothetical protein
VAVQRTAADEAAVAGDERGERVRRAGDAGRGGRVNHARAGCVGRYDMFGWGWARHELILYESPASNSLCDRHHVHPFGAVTRPFIA